MIPRGVFQPKRLCEISFKDSEEGCRGVLCSSPRDKQPTNARRRGADALAVPPLSRPGPVGPEPPGRAPPHSRVVLRALHPAPSSAQSPPALQIIPSTPRRLLLLSPAGRSTAPASIHFGTPCPSPCPCHATAHRHRAGPQRDTSQHTPSILRHTPSIHPPAHRAPAYTIHPPARHPGTPSPSTPPRHSIPTGPPLHAAPHRGSHCASPPPGSAASSPGRLRERRGVVGGTARGSAPPCCSLLLMMAEELCCRARRRGGTRTHVPRELLFLLALITLDLT